MASIDWKPNGRYLAEWGQGHVTVGERVAATSPCTRLALPKKLDAQ